MTRSGIPRGRLAEILAEARRRTGVPAAAAGLLIDGEVESCALGEVSVETPFRVASLTKWLTACLALTCLDLDEPSLRGASARALLSHTAGWRPESPEPLPAGAQGLWSYSNAGYRAVGEACASACGRRYADAVRERLLEPLGMTASGFERPRGAAPGHVQEGETGHRPVGDDRYPEERYPGGGLWSTVPDMLRFAAHQLGGPGPLSAAQRAETVQPQVEALGAAYGLGVWRRLAGGREAFEHSGSVAGFQSLLLLVPAERAALVVLTNSWRGNGLIQRVVRSLGLAADPPGGDAVVVPEPGRFELDGDEAVVERHGDGLRVAESALDPVTGDRIRLAPYPVDSLGGGVYGFAGGVLMAHRLDFPRPGVARVGWVALPRAGA